MLFCVFIFSLIFSSAPLVFVDASYNVESDSW